MLPPTYRAAVERAKLYERLAPDLVAAARWANEALSLASNEEEREEASHRLKRIERKLSRT
jgi:hypothetical protein